MPGFGYTLRPYQQQAIAATWGYLCNQQGNPVVVLPTGAGKSIVIADIAKDAAKVNRKVLVVAHRKELIRQNAEKIRTLAPMASVGIYSAGLKRRDTEHDVIFAGIQSVWKRAFDFGERHLVIVDEAHLIPAKDAGMYSTFLADLRTANPDFRLVGMTATPFRLDSGLIYGPDQIFDGVAIDVPVGELIKDGYLSQITSRPVTEIDMAGVHHRAGEFNRQQMEARFDEHVIAATEETVAIAEETDRKSILVFASGVTHSQHIAECINAISGEEAAVITGDTLPLIRESILEGFANGNRKWLINVDVLTTGFDAPCIDMLSIMRATESPGLFAQIVGRGLRKSPGKNECIVADFGGNLRRHGPIDSKDYGKNATKKKSGDGGEAPGKDCPSCESRQPISARVCDDCGWRFPPPESQGHDGEADRESAVLESEQQAEWWEVIEQSCNEHTKKGADDDHPKTLRMNYQCRKEGEEGNLGQRQISEWVCIEHGEGSYARRKAETWWAARSETECPETIMEAQSIIWNRLFAETKRIKAIPKGRFYEIVDHELGPIPNWEPGMDDDDDEYRDPFAPDYVVEDIPF